MTTQTRRNARTQAPPAASASKARETTNGVQPLPDGLGREEMIRRLAYERYQNNGCVDGHALDDWLAAEQSVCSMAGP